MVSAPAPPIALTMVRVPAATETAETMTTSSAALLPALVGCGISNRSSTAKMLASITVSAVATEEKSVEPPDAWPHSGASASSSHVLFGNIDPSGVLANGTVEEVREATRQLISTWKPGGRFILNSGCAIPPTTPPENIRAMIETARECGEY